MKKHDFKKWGQKIREANSSMSFDLPIAVYEFSLQVKKTSGGTDFTSNCAEWLNTCKSHVSRLRAAGESLSLMDKAIRNKLPMVTSILAELNGVDSDLLQEWIAAGDLTSASTRDQVRRLKVSAGLSKAKITQEKTETDIHPVKNAVIDVMDSMLKFQQLFSLLAGSQQDSEKLWKRFLREKGKQSLTLHIPGDENRGDDGSFNYALCHRRIGNKVYRIEFNVIEEETDE